MTPLDVGFHPDVIETRYHSDPAPEPSLSNSIAKLIYDKSPRHAWLKHPKLNPEWTPEDKDPKRPMEIGTAAHKMLLGKGRNVRVIDYPDYKPKAAQQERAAAYAAGDAPLVRDDAESVEALVKAAREQIADDPETREFLDPGQSELTMLWRDKGAIWCRGRIDRLPNTALEGGHVTVFDLKTTGASAHPEEYPRTFYDADHDTQDPFYRRGIRTLIPGIRTIKFVFIVIEQKPPYAMKPYVLGGQAAAEAEEKVEIAIDTWGACLRRNEWPRYTKGVHHIDPPTWRSYAHELRKMSMQNRLNEWQAPHKKTGEAA